MMTRKLITVLTLAAMVSLAPAFAEPGDEVTIRTEQDDKRNTVYKLVNTGARNIRVTLEHQKSDCSGVSNNRKPTRREYWIEAGRSLELRKVMYNSSCRHDYRIVGARYY